MLLHFLDAAQIALLILSSRTTSRRFWLSRWSLPFLLIELLPNLMRRLRYEWIKYSGRPGALLITFVPRWTFSSLNDFGHFSTADFFVLINLNKIFFSKNQIKHPWYALSSHVLGGTHYVQRLNLVTLESRTFQLCFLKNFDWLFHSILRYNQPQTIPQWLVKRLA